MASKYTLILGYDSIAVSQNPLGYKKGGRKGQHLYGILPSHFHYWPLNNDYNTSLRDQNGIHKYFP